MRLLGDPDIANKLVNYRRLRKKVHSDNLENIYYGEIYKKYERTVFQKYERTVFHSRGESIRKVETLLSILSILMDVKPQIPATHQFGQFTS